MADVKVTEGVLADLIASKVREEVAKLMTATSPDEAIQKALDRHRGKDRPLPPEELVECASPITGATFTARLIASRTYPAGRVIELLEYTRPAGWDRHKVDGGLVPDGMEMVSQFRPGKPDALYANWVRKTFWEKDLEVLVGRALPPQWRVDAARAGTADVPAGSVILTPDQLEKLGITAADVAKAVGDQAAE